MLMVTLRILSEGFYSRTLRRLGIAYAWEKDHAP